LNVGDTENSEAYSLVKRGRELLRGHSRNDTKRAEGLFKKAIELDPNYADAYSGLAYAELQSPGVSLKEPKESIPSAKRYLEKALEINPNHVRSRILKLRITLRVDWNTENIPNDIDSLISQHRNNPFVLGELGSSYTYSNQYEKSITILKQGLALDPKNSMIHAHLAFAYLLAGDLERSEFHNAEAVKLTSNYQFALHIRSLLLTDQNRFSEIEKQLKESIENDDKNPVTIMSLGIVYWRKGMQAESYKLLAELLDRRNFEYIKGGIISRLYAAMGEKEKALKWLIKSREEKDTDFFHMYYWPLFDEARNDPEFVKIYKDAGLYDYLTQKMN